MTIEKDKVVRIPIWVISVLLPVLVAGVISFGQYKYSSGRTETKLDHIELKINSIEQTKVDSKTFDMLIQRLDRIDDRLERIESNQPK